MATVSQTIPNYYGGISEQPDELKIPGQVKSLKNVIPDITHGLLKRPGGKLIKGNMGSVTGAEKTKWFHYYRTEEEQYIGQIKLSDGSVKMWCLSDVINTAGQVVYTAGSEIEVVYEGCGYITVTNGGSGYTTAPTVTLTNTSGSDGSGATATAEIEYGKVTKVTVTNAGKNYTNGVTVAFSGGGGSSAAATAISPTTEIKNYLKTTNSAGLIDPGDVQVLTLNDYTYITNRNKKTEMRTDTGSLATSRPPEAYIELKKVAYASQYSVNLFDDLTTTEIPTATRLEITQEINTSNACGSNSKLPSEGTLPGGGDAQNRCNHSDNKGNDDERMGNVGTEIFAIEHNGWGNKNSANVTAHQWKVSDVAFQNSHAYSVGDSITEGAKIYYCTVAGTSGTTAPSHTSGIVTHDGVSWDYRGVPTDRKQLYFRLTCTGQPVAQGQAEQPDYYAVYTVTHDLLYGGEGWREGDFFYVWMKNAKYKIKVTQDSIAKVQCNLGKIRPQPTSFDTKTAITAESILGSIRAEILGHNNGGVNTLYQWKQDADNEYNVRQIGNGIYISRPAGEGTFGITSPVGELLNVFTNSVKDIADLPSQCKHGYIVRVANSTADEDDYYVQFIGNDDRDGEGVWEECPQQGRQVAFKEETMPISLIRTADFKFRATFIDGHKYTVTLSGGTADYQPPSWADCGVGSYYPDTNSGTAMPPSFIGFGISKMLFFRNRMVLLSDENVIMSRPGKFFNFWPKTATTYTPSDNVDLSCSSEQPAIVYDGIQVNQGLLLFTKNQQFMLTTDSDVLSPNTAKINALCTYNFNSNTNPISLGSTVGFLDDGGKFARFFEITSATREGQPEVLEQTKAVAKSFPKGINIIANSRENSVLFFAKQGERKVYCYRYFQSPRKRVLQSWFQWELSGDIQHLSMLDDVLYAVIRNRDIDVLQKFNIKVDDDSNTLVDDQGTLTDDSDDVTYRVHLDNSHIIPSTAYDESFTATTGQTAFTATDTISNDVVVYKGGAVQSSGWSRSGDVITFDSAPGNGVVVRLYEERLKYTASPSPGFTTFNLPPGFTQCHLTGTYTRVGNIVTVTSSTAHEYTVGQKVNLVFTVPTLDPVQSLTDGIYTVLTVPATNKFTITSTHVGTLPSNNVVINPLAGVMIVADGDLKGLQGTYAAPEALTTTTDAGVTKVKVAGDITKYKIADDIGINDGAKATRDGDTVTIDFTTWIAADTDRTQHPFKVGDVIVCDFASGIADGTHTVTSVLNDSDGNPYKLTVTNSASGSVTTPVNVAITSEQTPTNNIVFGYLFDMEVKFPTIYKQDQIAEGSYRADIHSTLVVHRVKLSFGHLGVYNIEVQKKGKDTYTETFLPHNWDDYKANEITFEADKKVTLPIYEKNINVDLTLKSTHPSPSTLYSLSWEGDYTDGYYKRV
tara:strand:- start:8072 stop:12313 length:4242 start_codon:yes stop_codon:yes gene_type:complete